MMLEINLLPGATKGKSRGGFTLAGVLPSFGSGIRDPFLIAATACVVMSMAAVGTLYTVQRARTGQLAVRMDKASRDSTRYTKVLAARRKLTAERDSVLRQLSIIRTIDESRYNWAHILDEVSRALPAYTWLTIIEQTTKAPAPPGADTLAARGEAPVPVAGAAATKAGARIMTADTIAIHPPLGFRLVGQTVDIQALTMFMRQLESSPFLQRVMLARSEIVIVDGKDVTQFELSAEYEVPPPGVVVTAPLVVPVR